MSQAITSSTPVASLTEAAAVQRALRQFLRPLLTRLAGQMDVRLVRTLRDAVEAIVRVRNRPQELWLTELGALLLGAARAPAGVKRLSRLLHAAGWTPDDLEQGLLEQADALLARQPAGEALVILDERTNAWPRSPSRCGRKGCAACGRASRGASPVPDAGSAADHRRRGP